MAAARRKGSHSKLWTPRTYIDGHLLSFGVCHIGRTLIRHFTEESLLTYSKHAKSSNTTHTAKIITDVGKRDFSQIATIPSRTKLSIRFHSFIFSQSFIRLQCHRTQPHSLPAGQKQRVSIRLRGRFSSSPMYVKTEPIDRSKRREWSQDSRITGVSAVPTNQSIDRYRGQLDHTNQYAGPLNLVDTV